MNTIDMSAVIAILTAAQATTTEMDGTEWSDDVKNSPEKAALSRDISHLADQLFLASGLVRNEYWIGKGFEDATFETP